MKQKVVLASFAAKVNFRWNPKRKNGDGEWFQAEEVKINGRKKNLARLNAQGPDITECQEPLRES